MTYHIFSGLYLNSGTFESSKGIGLWCNYNSTSNLYTTDPLLSFVIDTPTYPQIPGGINLDGELCGSAPITVANGQDFGPANGLPTFATFPLNKDRFALGAVDLPEYVSTGGTLSPTDWNDNFAQIGFRGNGSNTTVSKLPGQVTPSTDFYNVIVAANEPLGVTTADSGGRVHWDVAVGTLGQFVSKILGVKIGRVPGPSLGTVNASTPDELAAGIMLISGYGILKNDALAFATQPPPA